ncbi:inositol transporter 4-like [Euphorbia lathyris]|uniref:inositol transporter 4-like n=1 Tax=Euphorbia lathyris TaxID=212925 RepID=UPI003313BD83
MVEGGVVGTEDADFGNCWRVSWRTPYIMRLALSAGIGGLLFGYDTGNISGALLYIRDDFERVDKSTFLQELIVSMTVVGAIIGAAFGGVANDKFGRKKTILAADVVFFIGAIIMALAPTYIVIILGRFIIGLGVGMASMTAPLYISEASPASIRGALVSINGLLITGGQFLAYLINLAFVKTAWTWRWMLGVAAIPPLVQFFLMVSLPESPRWLYRENKVEEAKEILSRIYPADQVEKEIQSLAESIDVEKKLDEHAGKDMITKLKGAFTDLPTRRALYAGVTVQVAQQFVGINTVMYYSPTIVQFAGYASNSVALALSVITSGLNLVGTVISMLFVDRYGRRRLMIISMFGIIFFLIALAVVFQEASLHSPGIDLADSRNFHGPNNTCSSIIQSTQIQSAKLSCTKCLKYNCAFCANQNTYQPGACLVDDKQVEGFCKAEHRTWFSEGCPSKFGFLAVVCLGIYIIFYAPGMGTAPWIVNSEIYPLRYRGIGGGIAAVANWTSNLIVSLSFLSMIEAFTVAGAFIFFAMVSFVSLCFIYWLVPETKGLQMEEIEKMLRNGFTPELFRKKEAKAASGPA